MPPVNYDRQPHSLPLRLNKLFFPFFIAEKAVPDFFIGYKNPVCGIYEKGNGYNYPHGFINFEEGCFKYVDCKSEIKENHYSSEDREDPVIHFSAVHCNQVNLTNISLLSFFAADTIQ